MTELHVSITGDCAGLVGATKNATAALDDFAGRSATVSIGLAGASGVVSGLNGVGAARDRAGGTVSLGVDSTGISAARGQLSGLRGDLRSVGRDLDSLGGSRTLGLSDGGSIRQLTGDLGSATRGYAALGAESQGALSGMERSYQGVSERASGATADLGSFSLASSHVAASGELAASAGSKVEASIGNVQTLARSATADIQNMASAMASGGGSSLSGAGDSVVGSLDNASNAVRKSAIGGGG
ncbi:MAG TPA: hypothetical protein VFE08_10785, partial [Candidatus Sulfotelmatobacter sp.]|nr:hypothetical protein [Candidatus Sulfotelmatobacter sp.]